MQHFRSAQRGDSKESRRERQRIRCANGTAAALGCHHHGLSGVTILKAARYWPAPDHTLGQRADGAHPISHDLNIPFSQLQTKVTGPNCRVLPAGDAFARFRQSTTASRVRSEAAMLPSAEQSTRCARNRWAYCERIKQVQLLSQ